MNNMKHIIHSKFTNLGGKLRMDKSSNSDSLALPQYAESLYISSKNDKDVYNELYKKMSTICTHNYSVTDDKKMKKNSWESLSSLVSDSEKKLSDDSLTKEVMANSITVLDEMARSTKEFEKTLCQNVIKHFHDLSEDNTLTNTKKSLTSLYKDMKTNSDKVQTLQDQLNIPTNEALSYRKSAEISNAASTENKLLSAQVAEENTEKEWENKKDFYLTKLFVAEAEKFKSAEKVVEFLQDYLDYFSDCQKILSKSIPEIKTSLNRNKNIYAFHTPLEEHLAATNRKLSYVLETCIQELDNDDTLQHEGLFRISGGKNKLELLKSALNVMRVDDFISKGCDSAVFAGVLKQYLRELPIPLMTYDLYDKWCEVGMKIRQNDVSGSISSIMSCLTQMSPCYFDNLTYLMQFLKKITAYESVNKMSASNLGLMLGPNLIRNKLSSDGDDTDASVKMMLGSPGGAVLEFMIIHFAELFPNAPVYPTASRIIIKVSEMSSNTSLNEKKIRQINEDDSQSSGDILLEDTLSITGAESDNLRIDSALKSPRDVPAKPKSFRKAPAPPPPPQSKACTTENETDIVGEIVPVRVVENRPTVKKRTSRLERPSVETTPDIDESSLNNSIRRATSSIVVTRPAQTPTIPTKKPIIISQNDSLERPTRPDNPPPKRPNNPPPPIPPFEKQKDNIDQKPMPVCSIEGRKQSFQDEVLSTSIDPNESTISSTLKTKHKYSSSDTSFTTF